VLGCAATYHTIFGTPLPPAWEEVAERDAVHRYGPPVLDNDQPITEEWLTSPEWKKEDREFTYYRDDKEFVIYREYNDGTWRAYIDGILWRGRDLRTRGQLRALLTAIYGETR
jgi:hypothetical protein